MQMETYKSDMFSRTLCLITWTPLSNFKGRFWCLFVIYSICTGDIFLARTYYENETSRIAHYKTCLVAHFLLRYTLAETHLQKRPKKWNSKPNIC